MQKSDEKDTFNVSEILLSKNLKKRSNKIAYHLQNEDYSKKITYLELSKMMNRIGFGLKNLGVNFENRVMILDNDTIEAVSCILGTIKIGAIPFAANTMIKPIDYEYLLNDSRATTAIVGKDYLERIISIKSRLKYLKNLIVIGKSTDDAISFNELVNKELDDFSPFNMPPDEVVLWQYSSGTTGQPKGVMHTQNGILHTADTYFKQVLELKENDVCFSVSKLFFGFGQGNSMWGPLRAGASAVLSRDRFNTKNVLNTIETNRVTILFAAPTHYNKILDDLDTLKKYDLSSLRICVSAGESLPPILYRKWKKITGIDILDGIGSTEAFHIFMSNRINNVKPGSSGTPIPGYKVRIVDPQYNDVPVGERGRLLVKGKSIASSYWNKYDKTKKTFIGEWLLTGDIYYQNDDGFYWYCGRSDDMIRSGGVWVSPIEVETVLMEHPSIQEAAAVQGYTSDGLQRVKAVVTLKYNFNPSLDLVEEIKQYTKSKLPSYKKPEWIDFVNELPKTSTGKIQRFKFRKDSEQHLKIIRKKQIDI